MDTTRPTRPRRLLTGAALLALPIAALLGVACGGKVVVDADPGTNGEGGAGGGTSGVGGSGSGSSGFSTATAGCSLTSSGTGGTDLQVTACVGQVDNQCPNQYEATMYLTPSKSCSYVVSVDCGPIEQVGICCYLVTEEIGGCAP